MMQIKDKLQEVEAFFTERVGNFYDPEGKFKEKLIQKIKGNYDKEIIVKFGIDPTRPDIHLGHAVVFQKLRKLQEFGCKIVFLIGDFTATIGDPTGKSKTRPEIEFQELLKNIATYEIQADKVIDTKNSNLYSIIRNSDWFHSVSDIKSPEGAKVTFTIDGKQLTVDANSSHGKAYIFDVTRLQRTALHKQGYAGVTLATLFWTLKHITHSRLIERDMFQERIKNGQELYMHEMLYPVLQGIDSHIISLVYGSCDLEVGGTDQTFNMLIGRDVMKANHVPEPQAVLAFKILPGTDGKEKMSKSLNNYISITEQSSEMFGKVMSIPDSVILDYFELCTFSPVEEIRETLKKGTNPRDVKLRLAKEITAIYHGNKSAEAAAESFVKTFSGSKKEIPEDALEINVKENVEIADVLLKHKIVSSKTDFRRLVSEKAIKDLKTGKSIESFDEKVTTDLDLKVGKHRFIKIRVK